MQGEILADIFETPAMRTVWSDAVRVQRYLDVEAALALVQGRLGVVPAGAADEIRRHCDAQTYDFAKLKATTEKLGSSVMPVVQQLVAACAGGHGEWCHWGATTQDITDTATVMQIRDSLDLVEADLRAIAAGLAGLARTHRDTPMAGRSNLQQATPVTFGYKCAVMLAGVERHLDRLAELRLRVLVGQFAGATGTLASLGADGLRVQDALMDALGLGRPEIAWHTMRDRIAEVGCFMGLVTGTLGKLALDVRLLMQTEVGEVSEPFAAGRGSSSTMPQKRNPVASVFIQAGVSMVRQHVAALLEAMVQDHERATGTWQIEWIALPDLFCLSAGVLGHARFLVEGLQVDPVRMRENLGLTRGLTQAEAVMMGLGAAMGRQRAHDVVYDICREVAAGRGTFLDLLAGDAEIAGHMDRAGLAALLDPANYTGLAGEMVDRVLSRRESRAG